MIYYTLTYKDGSKRTVILRDGIYTNVFKDDEGNDPILIETLCKRSEAKYNPVTKELIIKPLNNLKKLFENRK